MHNYYSFENWIFESIPESLKSLNSWIYCERARRTRSSSAWTETKEQPRGQQTIIFLLSIIFAFNSHPFRTFVTHPPAIELLLYCSRGLAHLLPSRPKTNRGAGYCFLYLSTRLTPNASILFDQGKGRKNGPVTSLGGPHRSLPISCGYISDGRGRRCCAIRADAPNSAPHDDGRSHPPPLQLNYTTLTRISFSSIGVARLGAVGG